MAQEKDWKLRDQEGNKVTITIAERTRPAGESEPDTSTQAVESSSEPATLSKQTIELKSDTHILTITIAE